MSVSRVSDLLQDRYEDSFLGLLQKITRSASRKPCCCSNKFSTQLVGGAMRQSLGESIKNAINRALLTDKEQHGALIVGGRRRNRKKRNKNKSARKKKNARKEDGKVGHVMSDWNNQEDNYDVLPVDNDMTLIIGGDINIACQKMKKGGKGVRQNSEKRSRRHSEADPWCLVCGVNLRVDGRSYVSLTQDNAEGMRKLFAEILDVEVRDYYASVNLCNKCERALSRISRYQGTDSAMNEARSLRESLEKNLNEHDQQVVSASKEHEVEVEEEVVNEVSVEYESPLIENEVKVNTRSEPVPDEEQGTDPDLDQGQEPENPEQDKENIHPEKMPFSDFFKTTRKKKDKKEKKEKKGKKDKKKLKENENENQTGDAASETPTDTNQSQLNTVHEPEVRPGTLAALAQTVPPKPKPVANWDSEPDQDVADGGETYTSKYQSNEASKPLTESQDVDEKEVKTTSPDETEMKPVVVSEPTKKSEHSPLIKESKLNDTGPGFLCCTIL